MNRSEHTQRPKVIESASNFGNYSKQSSKINNDNNNRNGSNGGGTTNKRINGGKRKEKAKRTKQNKKNWIQVRTIISENLLVHAVQNLNCASIPENRHPQKLTFNLVLFASRQGNVLFRFFLLFCFFLIIFVRTSGRREVCLFVERVSEGTHSLWDLQRILFMCCLIDFGFRGGMPFTVCPHKKSPNLYKNRGIKVLFVVEEECLNWRH